MYIQTESESLLHYLSPLRMLSSLWSQRSLLYRLTRREIGQRYKGLQLGALWTLITPILMLSIYTLVFGVILKVRWAQNQSGGLGQYALTLFCGLLVFNIFSECMNRAPVLILQNRNYVKKVVFPLEILPCSVALTAFFHGLLSLMVLVIANAVLTGGVHATLAYALPVLLPLFFFVLGVGWLLAGLGVYLRDLQQVVRLASTALFFLTPIIYSIDVVPEKLRPWLKMNPLCSIVSNLRSAVLWGKPFNWGIWAVWSLATALFMLVCYAVFMRLKKGFADVV